MPPVVPPVILPFRASSVQLHICQRDVEDWNELLCHGHARSPKPSFPLPLHLAARGGSCGEMSLLADRTPAPPALQRHAQEGVCGRNLKRHKRGRP